MTDENQAQTDAFGDEVDLNPLVDEPEVAEEKAEPEPEPEPQKKAEPSWEDKYNNLRAANSEARAEMATVKADLARTQSQLQQFETLRQQLDEHRRAQESAKSIEAEKAKFDENPAEYLLERQRRVEEAITNYSQHQQEQLRAHQDQEVFVETVRRGATEFAKENPDYREALQFAHEKRLREYELLGIPEHQREQMFLQESMTLSATAMAQGRNPAEVAYNIAKSWGFGQSKAQSDSKQQKADPNARIDQLERGIAASQSMSGDGEQEEQTMLKQIEEMSDREFDKYWNEQVAPRPAH